MKLVKYRPIGNDNALQIHYKIESHEELCYIEFICQLAFDNITKCCIESGEAPYRYGHNIGMHKGIEKALFVFANAHSGFGRMSELTAQTMTKNPLLFFNEAIKSYMTTLTKTFIRAGHAYISFESGGIQSDIVKLGGTIEDEKEIIEINGYRPTVNDFRKHPYFW